MNDLREYSEFNNEFLAAVCEAKKAGKSVDDIAASWKIPANSPVMRLRRPPG